MEDRLKETGKLPIGAHLDDKKAALEKAILGITVCDPACGSGHFLLEAARRLGRELALQSRTSPIDVASWDLRLSHLSNCPRG